MVNTESSDYQIVGVNTWLVTGVAGFIGSNILKKLLTEGQLVVGLDNFATGHRKNLLEIEEEVGPEIWKNFTFYEGDIRDSDLCFKVCSKVDIVLHQAALGSVPRSVNDPILSNDVNVSGFLNVLNAARITGVRKFVYAASSSTYGDHPALPKVEEKIGNALSPYAVTKYANELYADVFSRTYGMSCIGLRYFNVFGERQDPSGPYSAVIPKWIASMLDESEVIINGDGSTSRDFCYIDNAVQANILAGLASDFCGAEVFNIAVGGQTSLIELFESIKGKLLEHGIQYERKPEYCGFREGDVLHSQADISKAKKMLNYQPKFSLDGGLTKAIPWYLKNASR